MSEAESVSEISWEASKKEGNNQFGNNNFEGAIVHYTAALSSATLTSGDRSIILNNRALAFLKLKRNEQAVEDCTASLIQSNDNDSSVKAYFRRCDSWSTWSATFTACEQSRCTILATHSHFHTLLQNPQSCRATAYEAMGLTKDALNDYKSALERGPEYKAAQEGLLRCEVKLGLPPSKVGGVSKSGKGPTQRAVTDEEARGLLELQNRIKEVKKQQFRAAEQKKGAELEKKRTQLTISQLTQLPPDRPVYTSLGRMYAASSVAGELGRLEEVAKRAEDKCRVCEVTQKHLADKEREEDAAFVEALEAIKRRK